MKYSMWFFGVAAIYIAPHLPSLVATGLGLILCGLGFYAISKGD